MQMNMKGDSYTAWVHILTGSATNVRNDVEEFHLANVDEMRGRWTDLMIHFDTANGNESLEVFVNGERRMSVSDFVNFVPKAYNFKYGIYRSFVSRHGGAMPAQVVVIDEVRMGRTSAEVMIDEQRPVD